MWPEAKKRTIVRFGLTPKAGELSPPGPWAVKVTALVRRELAPHHLAEDLRPCLAAVADVFPGATTTTEQKIGRPCVIIEITTKETGP
jgi:hypothetical protein